jgi:DNA polymerase-3 subunit beta
MKLTVEKDALVAGLQRTQAVVGGKTTLPVLSNLLFCAEGEQLILTATDLELTVRATIAAKVSKAGMTTLPAKRIVSIVREMSGTLLEIDVGERDIATINCDAAEFRLNGISAEDFPVLPVFEGGHPLVLEAARLKAMLQRVGYAASTDESRRELNGALMSFRANRLTIVATDGKRLALAEHEMDVPKEAEADAILPTKTVNELLRSIPETGNVRIQVSKNQAAFEGDGVTVISKLVEGTFPNYRQVIPSRSEQRVAIERELFANAARRVALVTSDESNSIKLTFAKNRVEITASAPNVGEARETVPLKYTGKEIAISFNPEYLSAPLRVLTSDEIYLELTDELSPAVMKANEPFLYVLMPMRVS